MTVTAKKITEQTLANWTGPASDAEEKRYKWTASQIREALAASTALSKHAFEVYPQGSYPNFTNVVRDSDVDIAVELTEIIDVDFIGQADGLSVADVLSVYSGGYSLAAFKDDVEKALIAQFGTAAISRGKKSIHVRETTRGLAADVVPGETHRTYFSRSGYSQGIAIRNDKSPIPLIHNFPHQHLDNGVAKNERASKRYKRVVRILKRLENQMVKEGVIQAVPSFLIESAVWNVGTNAFLTPETWLGRVREVLATIYQGTKDDSALRSTDWMEVNNIKYLFHSSQGWTHAQANAFAYEAWNYLGL
jgi:hypothetical protein